MPHKGDQHVVPYDDQWAVRGENKSRVASVHGTQQEAIDAARDIARNQGGELLIHGRNGQIRRRDSSGGKDRSPPRG